MSVGFILVSPYWQYVTVYLGNPLIKSIFLMPPLGFSMNQNFGDKAMMRPWTWRFTRSQNLAYSETGNRLSPPPASFRR